MANKDGCSIDILLSSYNGANYISEQIESILFQSNKNWRLLVRDDGSTDNTVEIVRKYSQKYPERILYINEQESNVKNLGASQSFFRLLQYAKSDYVMFCDQDDVWLPNKIEVTLNEMIREEKDSGKNTPILVHTDLQITDERLNILSKSYYKYRGVSCKIGKKLNRLLIQNVVVGCTVMINLSLKNKIKNISDMAIMHDWWLALIANVFGKIVFLDAPTILYRQHSFNVAGAKKWGLKYFWKMSLSLRRLKQNFLATQKQAMAFLDQYRDELTCEQLSIIQTYAEMKNYNFLKRKILLIKNGYFMSGFIRNLVILLFVSADFN